MQLQNQLSRKIGNKKYTKYVITISPKIVEKLGWEAKEKLDYSVEGKTLKIRKK